MRERQHRETNGSLSVFFLIVRENGNMARSSFPHEGKQKSRVRKKQTVEEKTETRRMSVQPICGSGNQTRMWTAAVSTRCATMERGANNTWPFPAGFSSAQRTERRRTYASASTHVLRHITYTHTRMVSAHVSIYMHVYNLLCLYTDIVFHDV